MKEKYRIFIVDDSTILREALRSLLSKSGDFCVVGEAQGGDESIQRVEELEPHLVLMDLSMPEKMGWELIQEMKCRFPKMKILAFTVHRDENYIVQSFRAGADGYILKDATHSELVTAIKIVLAGRRFVSPGISGKVIKGYLDGKKACPSSTSWDSLTDRERHILKLIAEGYKYREIADYLCISPATVEKHRTNIGRKLNLHNISSLVTIAFEKGITAK